MKKNNEDNTANEATEPTRTPSLVAADFLSAKPNNPITALDHVELEELIGADALGGGACLKAVHSESPAIVDTLPSALEGIAAKLAEGAYDVQTLPIAEALIDKCFELEALRTEKEDRCLARRVASVKEANQKAREAVSKARSEREQAVRESVLHGDARVAE
jgi:hypothetical protein